MRRQGRIDEATKKAEELKVSLYNMNEDYNAKFNPFWDNYSKLVIASRALRSKSRTTHVCTHLRLLTSALPVPIVHFAQFLAMLSPMKP